MSSESIQQQTDASINETGSIETSKESSALFLSTVERQKPVEVEEKINIKLNKITTENMVNFLKTIYLNNALVIRELSINKQQGSLNLSALISYRYKKP